MKKKPPEFKVVNDKKIGIDFTKSFFKEKY